MYELFQNGKNFDLCSEINLIAEINKNDRIKNANNKFLVLKINLKTFFCLLMYSPRYLYPRKTSGLNKTPQTLHLTPSLILGIICKGAEHSGQNMAYNLNENASAIRCSQIDHT